jgi:hypothetical protein
VLPRQRFNCWAGVLAPTEHAVEAIVAQLFQEPLDVGPWQSLRVGIMCESEKGCVSMGGAMQGGAKWGQGRDGDEPWSACGRGKSRTKLQTCRQLCSSGTPLGPRRPHTTTSSTRVHIQQRCITLGCPSLALAARIRPSPAVR